MRRKNSSFEALLVLSFNTFQSKYSMFVSGCFNMLISMFFFLMVLLLCSLCRLYDMSMVIVKIAKCYNVSVFSIHLFLSSVDPVVCIDYH